MTRSDWHLLQKLKLLYQHYIPHNNLPPPSISISISFYKKIGMKNFHRFINSPFRFSQTDWMKSYRIDYILSVFKGHKENKKRINFCAEKYEAKKKNSDWKYHNEKTITQ